MSLSSFRFRVCWRVSCPTISSLNAKHTCTCRNKGPHGRRGGGREPEGAEAQPAEVCGVQPSSLLPASQTFPLPSSNGSLKWSDCKRRNVQDVPPGQSGHLPPGEGEAGSRRRPPQRTVDWDGLSRLAPDAHADSVCGDVPVDCVPAEGEGEGDEGGFLERIRDHAGEEAEDDDAGCRGGARGEGGTGPLSDARQRLWMWGAAYVPVDCVAS